MAYLIDDPAQNAAPHHLRRQIPTEKLLDPAVGSGHILVEGL